MRGGRFQSPAWEPHGVQERLLGGQPHHTRSGIATPRPNGDRAAYDVSEAQGGQRRQAAAVLVETRRQAHGIPQLQCRTIRPLSRGASTLRLRPEAKAVQMTLPAEGKIRRSSKPLRATTGTGRDGPPACTGASPGISIYVRSILRASAIISFGRRSATAP